jgi:RimJ/RimL family protein N-acetyltransferase
VVEKSTMISDTYTIETIRLVLRLIKKPDLNAVFDTMNSQRTAEIISFLTWPMTIEQAENWCQRSMSGLANKSDFMFIARKKNNHLPTGCISIHLQKEPSTGEVGYWVSEKQQGIGIASEMLQAVIEFAFTQLKLTKLIATAAHVNIPSQKMLLKYGFRVIGEKNLNTAKGTTLSCKLFELTRP